MMKTLTAVTLGLLLSAAALPALAGSSNTEKLGLCKAELGDIYGQGTRVKLKSIMNKKSGTHMRLQATPSDGERVTITCLVDREGMASIMGADGVAISAPATTDTDVVSLAD